jgi:Pup amidohydrolase
MPSLTYTRKRAMGTEQEYGLPGEANSDWFVNAAFLTNGGLVYQDCGHPEYASPEASNPLDAMLWDKAGELAIRRNVNPSNGQPLRFFKNNIDHRDTSFGAHESYTLGRDSATSGNLFNPMLAFLTTRIIFGGAGSINRDGNYEISQKARSVSECISAGTIGSCKPIVNLRDEPLSDSSKYFRFHVVSGDGNLSQVSSYLKMGTASLMLDLAEDRRLPRIHMTGTLDAYHRISRELTLKAKYKTDRGRLKATEIQRVYLDKADRAYRGRDTMTDDILDRWNFVLTTLERDPMELDGQLDWVIKRSLIFAHLNSKGGAMGDNLTRNIDLQYHETGPKGIFNIIQESGGIEQLVTNETINNASEHPPEDTRAFARGLTVRWGNARQITWNNLLLPGNYNFEMCEPLDDSIPAEIAILD